MTRRPVVVGAVALTLALGACGLGDRQAQADRISRAGERLLAAPSVDAVLHAQVRVLVPANKVVNPGPPRIAPENVNEIGVVLNGPAGTAAIGTNTKLNSNAIVFVNDSIYQRIVQKAAGVAGNATTAEVPSNFNALAAAYTTAFLPPAHATDAPTTTVPDFPGVVIPTTTTSTTTAPSVLRRRVQIVREWAAFDYAAIPDHDKTKHAGSLAINPVDLVRLARGVLAGSVKRRGSVGGTTSFSANVSRDKAEHKLNDAQRKILDKEFLANAVSRRVFPAEFVLDAQGNLKQMLVTLRQQLSPEARGDLTVSFSFTPRTEAVAITKPPKRGTVNSRTLGELVSTVTGR